MALVPLNWLGGRLAASSPAARPQWVVKTAAEDFR